MEDEHVTDCLRREWTLIHLRSVRWRKDVTHEQLIEMIFAPMTCNAPTGFWRNKVCGEPIKEASWRLCAKHFHRRDVTCLGFDRY